MVLFYGKKTSWPFVVELPPVVSLLAVQRRDASAHKSCAFVLGCQLSVRSKSKGIHKAGSSFSFVKISREESKMSDDDRGM